MTGDDTTLKIHFRAIETTHICRKYKSKNEISVVTPRQQCFSDQSIKHKRSQHEQHFSSSYAIQINCIQLYNNLLF